MNLNNTFRLQYGKESPGISIRRMHCLFQVLSGENRSGKRFIGEETQISDFGRFFNGSKITNQIRWVGNIKSLVYVFDEFVLTYCDVPDRILENISFDNRNSFSQWVNSKLSDCLVNEEGEPIEVSQLTDARNKLNPDKLQDKEVFDELFQKIDIINENTP